MFESLALENPRNTMRNWTTALSFALQTAGLGLLVLAPIGYTQAVAPKFTQHIVAPSGITNIETHARPRPGRASTSPMSGSAQERLIYTDTQRNVHRFDRASESAPLVDPNAQFMPWGPPDGVQDNMMNRLLASMKPSPPVISPSKPRTKPHPISQLDPGMLVKQVQPVYPAIARSIRIQGPVLLAAVIDTQGRIMHLRALRGHPLLIPAAIDAVQQWRYRPYILNGSPVEVETQITVNFILHN